MMTNSLPRKSAPRPSERPQSRDRNVYDCDGEYEFLVVEHWTPPEADTIRPR